MLSRELCEALEDAYPTLLERKPEMGDWYYVVTPGHSLMGITCEEQVEEMVALGGGSNLFDLGAYPWTETESPRLRKDPAKYSSESYRVWCPRLDQLLDLADGYLKHSSRGEGLSLTHWFPPCDPANWHRSWHQPYSFGGSLPPYKMQGATKDEAVVRWLLAAAEKKDQLDY